MVKKTEKNYDIINRLEKVGVVSIEDKVYYINVGEDKLELGKNIYIAQNKILKLQKEGKLKDLQLAPPKLDSSTEDKSSSNESLELEVNSPIPSLKDEANVMPKGIEALLGEIEDLKPNYVGQLDVMYNGVNVFDYTNPTVAKLGMIFRWRKRQDKEQGNLVIEDKGGNLTCNGWQVFMTDKFKLVADDIKINRNDTPKQNIITNGDLILCVARKDQYDKSQLKKQLQFMRAAKQDKEKRQDAGQRFKDYDSENAAVGTLKTLNDKDTNQEDAMKSEIEELAKEL